jgi:hypothetical protein
VAAVILEGFSKLYLKHLAKSCLIQQTSTIFGRNHNPSSIKKHHKLAIWPTYGVFDNHHNADWDMHHGHDDVAVL